MNIMSALLQTPAWEDIDQRFIETEIYILEQKKRKLLQKSRHNMSNDEYLRIYELDLEIEHWYEVLELMNR